MNTCRGENWDLFTGVSRTSLMNSKFDDFGTFKSCLLCGYSEEWMILESKGIF